MLSVCVFILLFTFTEQTAVQHKVCPPKFISHNGSRTVLGCLCYGIYSVTECFPLMEFGYCMTYNSRIEALEYGACPYITRYNRTYYLDPAVYIWLPENISSLNEFMCGPLNREGTLCGKCKDGYGTALYSYTLKCSKCWGHGYGWVLYWTLELVPITVMYFLVVIFHIRATSSPLSALVFMSQIVVYTIRLNVPFHLYIENELTEYPHILLQVLLVLCGIWSLDFFRSVIPPFCVSSNIKTVHALALEYLVAFYPIFLILFTYLCIKIHDNNFRPVVWLWKPFHRHFVHFRRRWDSKASIINAFTTFLLLSFSKILFVSFSLIYHIHIEYSNVYLPDNYVLYYDPTVECYTSECFIFLAIALFVLLIFIICPIVLLILYPTRLFRRCVSCCGFRRWHALHMFVESFHGQYKDGTNGTRDLRGASATFLVVRFLILVLFAKRERTTSHLTEFVCAVCMCASCFYAIAKPYKVNFMNIIDILILSLLTIISLATSTPGKTYVYVILTLVLLVPHMVLIGYICYVLAKKVGITQCLKRKYRTVKTCVLAATYRGQAEADMEAESDAGSLPDRLINPGEYEPVLQVRREHAAAEPTEDQEPDNEEPRRLTPVYTYGSIASEHFRK